MVEQQRLMEEERQRMRKEHEKRVKEEQKKILGKNNSRPKLSFTLKPVTWVCLITCSFTCDIYTSCRYWNYSFSARTFAVSCAYIRTWIVQRQRSKAHPECICDNHNRSSANVESFYLIVMFTHVRQNWIIRSILARFRNPMQAGSHLYETTLMSIQAKHFC